VEEIMERTNAELARMYGLTEKDIEGYRTLAARHQNRKPVEWWLDWAARAHQEFVKDGEYAAATKIGDGLKEEGRWTDYDEEMFKKYLEGQQP
jgi:hypothetical protein